jgi:hypothetical protein
MPNGYRRGHRYRRAGRTYYRRRARIKPATKKSIIGIALVGAGTMTALGSGMSVLVVAGALGLGYLLVRNRRKLGRPVKAKVTAWARRRQAARPRHAELFAKVPAGIPSNADPYLDAQLRPHDTDGKFISLDEYRRRREARGA